MQYLKSFVMTLSLFVLTVPVIHAGDVEDINSMVKKKVAVIFDLLGKQDIEKNAFFSMSCFPSRSKITATFFLTMLLMSSTSPA